MHIAEGFLPVAHCVAWYAASAPFVIHGARKVIEQAKVNIEYMYAFTFRKNDKAVLVFRFNDPDAAVKVLQDKGINVIGNVELY